jgi:hypothetical protein
MSRGSSQRVESIYTNDATAEAVRNNACQRRAGRLVSFRSISIFQIQRGPAPGIGTGPLWFYVSSPTRLHVEDDEYLAIAG